MDRRKRCSCTSNQISNYWKRISGPILDRIDLIVEVPSLLPEEVVNKPSGENSEKIKQRVVVARAVQAERFRDRPGMYTNSMMYPRDLKEWVSLSHPARYLLSAACERMGLSARAYDRVLKVSRTIADLAEETQVTEAHVAEALQYKASDLYVKK
jgi:magnesium chelatase family protein